MQSTKSDIKFPEKFFYKIGEVSNIVGVEPHVLRYWEKEFRLCNLNKSPTQQRRYIKKDIYKFLEIKELLYNKKYTVKGAKEILKKGKTKKNNILKELENIKSLFQNIIGA